MNGASSIDANRCVVLVIDDAYGETDVMGSALGEGSTAEQAEDRALQRLNDRFSNVADAPVRLSKAEPVKRLPANQNHHQLRPPHLNR